MPNELVYYSKAINQALDEELARDPDVVLIGEDIGVYGGALTEDGFDRFKCYAQLLKNDALYADLPMTDVCAKCVSIVPCSFKGASLRKRRTGPKDAV